MAKTRRIFVVDDDPIHNQMLYDHLSKNFSTAAYITTFETGKECLNQLNDKPDVVILDYHLGSKEKQTQNGIEILKQIKERNKRLEVIMLSAQDNIDIALDTIKHGAFDYVIKNESAFLRTQNIINNVFRKHDQTDRLKMYIASTAILAITLGCIVIYYIIYLMLTGF